MSNNTKHLLKLYEEMAHYVGLSFDNDGFLVINKSTGPEPVQYDGNRILLPTSANLKRNLVGEKIWFFHPLCEGAFEDESDIAMAYRQQLNVRLNMVATSIMTSLIGAASKSSAESNFTPTQLEFMVQLKEVDNTTLKNFSKYIRTSKFDRSILNIFVSKGATKEGKRFPRLGSTNFELYQNLKEGKGPEFFRTKDVGPIMALYQYLFPEIDVENAYMYGSASTIAPYTDALLRTAYQITERLNDVMKIWSDYLIDSTMEFDHAWVESFGQQEVLLKEIRMIPMQRNGAKHMTPTPAKKALAATPGDIPPWEPAKPAPVAPPAPVHTHHVVQPPQPQMMPQMPMMGGMMPQMGMMGNMPMMGGMMSPMGMGMMGGMMPQMGMPTTSFAQPTPSVLVGTTTGAYVQVPGNVAPYFTNTGGGFSRPVR